MINPFIMGFRINTNIAAMNSHTTSVMNNRALNGSLEKLSSGLAINKAADDSSGMAIADSLRSQANTLGQAIKNGNDGIGIIQVADKAMDEQVKILDTIKVKATQAAQDGQTEETRKMLQQDISKLMEEMDNIASTTSFNGQSLLSGSYSNKEFQIGAYSNQTVKLSIGPTSSDKVGGTRFETGSTITEAHVADLKFKAVDGIHDVSLETTVISTSAGTGIGALAEVINKNSNQLGVKASTTVLSTGSTNVTAGDVKDLTINGVKIGDVNDIKENDSDGKLISAINKLSDKHGMEATIDERGNLNLRSLDSRGMKVTTSGGSLASVLGMASGDGISADKLENYGRLTLTRLDGRDIVMSGSSLAKTLGTVSEATVNLRGTKAGYSVDQASAMGTFANKNTSVYSAARLPADGLAANYNGMAGIGAGVTTLKGAMAVMDIAETATKMLDSVRSNLGSTQNQLVATINNISVTQVNVKAAESQIRDVDFASESATFKKTQHISSIW
jgi:flagellin